MGTAGGPSNTQPKVDISRDVNDSLPMRVVLDTNVVVTAFRSVNGASNELLRQVAHGNATLLCSTALFLEYEAVLSRDEIRAATGHTLVGVAAIMDALASVAEPVDIQFSTRPTLRDPDDEMVLEVANNGGADVIATHNLRDFRPVEALGIDVASPGDVLRRLRK